MAKVSDSDKHRAENPNRKAVVIKQGGSRITEKPKPKAKKSKTESGDS